MLYTKFDNCQICLGAKSMFHECLSSQFYDFYPHLLIRKKASGKELEYVIIIFFFDNQKGAWAIICDISSRT